MRDSYRIIISPQAAADLEALHAFISKDSPDNAAKMVERILVTIDRLKAAPHRTVYTEATGKIRHPVRKVVVRPYIIYFRAIDNEQVVRILTIWHGARPQPPLV